jgi:hypothetical protein
MHSQRKQTQEDIKQPFLKPPPLITDCDRRASKGHELPTGRRRSVCFLGKWYDNRGSLIGVESK